MLRLWTNGVDWVVAEDPADVRAELERHVAMDGVAGPFGEEGDWHAMGDYERLHVPREGDTGCEIKDARDWVRWRGRGHLCSSLW